MDLVITFKYILILYLPVTLQIYILLYLVSFDVIELKMYASIKKKCKHV